MFIHRSACCALVRVLLLSLVPHPSIPMLVINQLSSRLLLDNVVANELAALALLPTLDELKAGLVLHGCAEEIEVMFFFLFWHSMLHGQFVVGLSTAIAVSGEVETQSCVTVYVSVHLGLMHKP